MSTNLDPLNSVSIDVIGAAMSDDAPLHVMEALLQAAEPMSTAQLVEMLKSAHDQESVIRALEHWHEQAVVRQLVDGRWSWIGQL